jgi:hypothetical protein
LVKVVVVVKNTGGGMGGNVCAMSWFDGTLQMQLHDPSVALVEALPFLLAGFDGTPGLADARTAVRRLG